MKLDLLSGDHKLEIPDTPAATPSTRPKKPRHAKFLGVGVEPTASEVRPSDSNPVLVKGNDV